MWFRSFIFVLYQNIILIYWHIFIYNIKKRFVNWMFGCLMDHFILNKNMSLWRLKSSFYYSGQTGEEAGHSTDKYWRSFSDASLLYKILDSSQQNVLYLCLLVQTNRSQRRPAPPWNRRTNTVLLFLFVMRFSHMKITHLHHSLKLSHAHAHTQMSHSQSRVTDLKKYKFNTKKRHLSTHERFCWEKKYIPTPFLFLFKTQLKINFILNSVFLLFSNLQQLEV